MSKDTQISISEIPVVGDIAYILFPSFNSFRLLKCRLVHIYKMYPTRESVAPNVNFIFIEDSNPLLEKNIECWGEEDNEEALRFSSKDYNKKFFFDKRMALKALHRACALGYLHIDIAKHCLGINIPGAVKEVRGKRIAVYTRNVFRSNSASICTLMQDLYKCGLVTCDVRQNHIDYSLTALGFQWLSIVLGDVCLLYGGKE